MDMTNPDFLILAADWLLLGYLVVLAGVGLWAIQGRVPTVIKTKYASGVMFMSQMPFAYRWRQAISTEDLPVFERARIRQHVFLVVISAGSLLISLYGYVNTVVHLWKCNMHGLGLLNGR